MPFILNSAFVASYIGFTSDHHSQRLISTSPRFIIDRASITSYSTE